MFFIGTPRDFSECSEFHVFYEYSGPSENPECPANVLS